MPRRATSTSFKPGLVQNPMGRPKKTPRWARMEKEVREAVLKLLEMKKKDFDNLLKNNPTVTEITAAKYISQNAAEVIDRFLGKVPNTIDSKISNPDGSLRQSTQNILAGWSLADLEKLIDATSQCKE